MEPTEVMHHLAEQLVNFRFTANRDTWLISGEGSLSFAFIDQLRSGGLVVTVKEPDFFIHGVNP